MWPVAGWLRTPFASGPWWASGAHIQGLFHSAAGPVWHACTANQRPACKQCQSGCIFSGLAAPAFLHRSASSSTLSPLHHPHPTPSHLLVHGPRPLLARCQRCEHVHVGHKHTGSLLQRLQWQGRVGGAQGLGGEKPVTPGGEERAVLAAACVQLCYAIRPGLDAGKACQVAWQPLAPCPLSLQRCLPHPTPFRALRCTIHVRSMCAGGRPPPPAQPGGP